MVSLWNGTRSSPSVVFLLTVLSTVQGHTSPSVTPPNERREGQMGFSPSKSAVQSAAIGTVLLPSSSWDSVSRKSKEGYQAVSIYQANKIHANDIARTTISSKELGASLEGLTEVEKKRGSTVYANHRIGIINLHGACHLLGCGVLQTHSYQCYLRLYQKT